MDLKWVRSLQGKGAGVSRPLYSAEVSPAALASSLSTNGSLWGHLCSSFLTYGFCKWEAEAMWHPQKGTVHNSAVAFYEVAETSRNAAVKLRHSSGFHLQAAL